MSISKSAKTKASEGRLLTKEELAWFWGVTPYTIDRLRREGKIKTAFPSEKNHRFSPKLTEGVSFVKMSSSRSLTSKPKKSSRPLKRKERLWE